MLLRWWIEQNVHGRHMWPGNFTSRVPREWRAEEIVNQVLAIERWHAEQGSPGSEPGSPEAVATTSGTAPTVGSTPSPSPRPAPSERPRAKPLSAARQGDDAIDLGSAVLPVLLQRYAGALAVGLAGFAVGVLVGRAGRE